MFVVFTATFSELCADGGKCTARFSTLVGWKYSLLFRKAAFVVAVLERYNFIRPPKYQV